MDKPQELSYGPVVLFGSGETSPSGRKVLDRIFRDLPTPPNVSLIETPAGFELNSAQVIGRVADFLQHRLQNYSPNIHIIPARKRNTRYSPDDPEIAAPILESDLIFMGPGSPTYAIRQLKDSLVWHYILARHRLGATIVMASAAVVALSRFALPVYEIYKVGEDPYWNNGLDLFGLYGLPLVLIPHWNNHDGGEELDSSRCFMGQSRFSQLVDMLPNDISIIGIDEKTALIIDPKAGVCQVMGNGGVTIIHTGHKHHSRGPDLRGTGIDELAAQRSAHVHVYKNKQTFPTSICCTLEPKNPVETIPAAVWQKAIEVHSDLKNERSRDTKQDVLPAPFPEDQIPESVKELIRERELARSQKDWARADGIRDKLGIMGWMLVDTPQGVVVRRA